MSPESQPVLCFTTRQDVDDLIADLRRARRASLRTGGAYGVHRADADGRQLLAIQVHLFREAVDPSHKRTPPTGRTAHNMEPSS